ncbi:MAG TPA: T9SS type A sorting domain-containing protein, partial [Saprospiraceae bacterium]|nr:T9SS type A sorting domain-containing protein [Saprospiraceae bacterium]
IDQFVLWNIEIDKAEADTLFEYNSFYIEFLKDLAYDNRLMTPKAQAILYQLYDTVFEPIQPVDMRSNKTRHIPVTLAEPVKIYPNPACNSINIELNLPDPILNGMYKIYDILGIEKLSGKIMSTNTNLDINGLFSGSYFLNLNYNGKSSFQRFSVIK